jgi:hypothetical protein
MLSDKSNRIADFEIIQLKSLWFVPPPKNSPGRIRQWPDDPVANPAIAGLYRLSLLYSGCNLCLYAILVRVRASSLWLWYQMIQKLIISMADMPWLILLFQRYVFQA